jgi:hypothetical protein
VATFIQNNTEETMENEIKEFESMKGKRYVGREQSHNTEHKNEK